MQVVIAMAPILPRPDVTVSTNNEGKTHVVISRDQKSRVYGVGANDKVKDAIEKILGDGHSAEWLP